MKLSELFNEEVEKPELGSKIKSILLQMREDPDNPRPYREAISLVLAGNKSPELEIIIRSGVHSGNARVIDEFADFMGRADDKMFKKYSDLLTDKIREHFKHHNSAHLKLKKFERTKAQIQADKKHDTFVFVAADKFKKTKDGKYERELDVESLVKIDKYDPVDLSAISMMRMRAHTREGGHVYIIKLPAGVVKEKVTHDIEPWLLHLIDEHKEKI